ncbi:MAG: hypothetical protein ACO3M7_05855, partial [Ilumatobacteraceae bacterium]
GVTLGAYFSQARSFSLVFGNGNIHRLMSMVRVRYGFFVLATGYLVRANDEFELLMFCFGGLRKTPVRWQK